MSNSWVVAEVESIDEKGNDLALSKTWICDDSFWHDVADGLIHFVAVSFRVLVDNQNVLTQEK